MTKKELRNIAIDKRNQLTEEEVEEMSLAIAEKLRNNILTSHAKISCFIGMAENNEVNTRKIFDSFRADFYAPVMLPQRELEHRLINNETKLIKNNWGILEPKESSLIEPTLFDFVIVPLLEVDVNGFRLGYGGGYYDRFLKKCSPFCKFIGVGFFRLIDAIPEVNEFDVPLNFYVSPNEIVKFD